MKTFAESVSEVGVIEKKPLFEGRSLTMVLGPKAGKIVTKSVTNFH